MPAADRSRSRWSSAPTATDNLPMERGQTVDVHATRRSTDIRSIPATAARARRQLGTAAISLRQRDRRPTSIADTADWDDSVTGQRRRAVADGPSPARWWLIRRARSYNNERERGGPRPPLSLPMTFSGERPQVAGAADRRGGRHANGKPKAIAARRGWQPHPLLVMSARSREPARVLLDPPPRAALGWPRCSRGFVSCGRWMGREWGSAPGGRRAWPPGALRGQSATAVIYARRPGVDQHGSDHRPAARQVARVTRCCPPQPAPQPRPSHAQRATSRPASPTITRR